MLKNDRVQYVPRIPLRAMSPKFNLSKPLKASSRITLKDLGKEPFRIFFPAGVLAGINYEALKNFRIIANGFYSNGGGRWIFGLGPDVIINSDGRPSLVHSASTVTGIEYQANPNNLFDAYYGGAYIYRSSALDLNGQPIGYGYSGSPLNHNRSLQQLTFGYTRTFWRDPNYGALQFISQYSYLTRNPWSVPVGQPSHANLNFVYLSIRYILPGAPPARAGQ
jgi:hypothetical protein